jgi:hypothetical protein
MSHSRVEGQDMRRQEESLGRRGLKPRPPFGFSYFDKPEVKMEIADHKKLTCPAVIEINILPANSFSSVSGSN